MSSHKRTPYPPEYRRDLADQLARLERRGVTTREAQARALGVSYRTLLRWIKAEGLARRASLKTWIPWTLRPEHRDSIEARHLRTLAQAAEQRPTKYRSRRGSAIQWATRIVEQDQDITYCDETGFVYKTADPADWYLKELLDAAQRYVLQLTQLDELGE